MKETQPNPQSDLGKLLLVLVQEVATIAPRAFENIDVAKTLEQADDAGQKHNAINEKRVRDIADLANKQHKGSYATESDATVSLVLIRSLALAVIGEELPVPGSAEDA